MPKSENSAAPKRLRGRPRDPERCRRILQAASHHFNTHGFERASMDVIAADADVSKMTIYSNFGSKEGLFKAVVRERTELVVGGRAGAEGLDPKRPQKALMAIGEQFLSLTREDEALGQFRSLCGAAGAQPEACQAFYRQGADRLIGDLPAYLRRGNAAGTLKVRNARQAADLFLSMFLGDGHIRGLLKLAMPDAAKDRALLREAVRVFIAAYAQEP